MRTVVSGCIQGNYGGEHYSFDQPNASAADVVVLTNEVRALNDQQHNWTQLSFLLLFFFGIVRSSPEQC